MELNKQDVLNIYGGQFWGFSSKMNFPEKISVHTPETIIQNEIVKIQTISTPEKNEISIKSEVVEIILPKSETKVVVNEEVKPIEKAITTKNEVPKIEIPSVSPLPPKEEFSPKNEIITPISSPFEGGEKIVWKMKKQSKLALVMEEEIFQNTLLMKALRVFLVEEIGINADNIGFGLFGKGVQKWNFEDMPTPFALHFGGKHFSEKNTISIKSKTIFLTFALGEIVLDRNKQATAKNTISEIKKLLDNS